TDKRNIIIGTEISNRIGGCGITSNYNHFDRIISNQKFGVFDRKFDNFLLRLYAIRCIFTVCQIYGGFIWQKPMDFLPNSCASYTGVKKTNKMIVSHNVLELCIRADLN